MVEVKPFRKGYKIGDRYVPRITTVLSMAAKPQLTEWKVRMALERVKNGLGPLVGHTIQITEGWVDELIANARKEPERIAGEAADVGTRAHAYIEATVKGETGVLDTDIIPCVEAWEAWRKSSGLVLKPGEVYIGSSKYGYAGTLDQPAYRGDKFVLIDYKTSNGIYDSYAWQVAAYAKAWEETTGESVSEAWIVRFPKEPNPSIPFEAKQIRDIDEAFKPFLACLELYNNQKRGMFL